MQNFLKIANVNVMPLMAAIIRQPELWNQHDLRQTFEDSPHKEVSDIWLRFNDMSDHDEKSVGDDCEAVDQVAFLKLPQARSLIFDLMRFVEGQRLGRVMITKLTPGKRIYPHADIKGKYAKYYNRYHIILQNLPGSVFRCGNESPCMNAGDIYWFNAAEEHEVINNSSDDRLTLIVDIKC